MKTEVNIRQLRYDAEEVFRIGGFYCSEAIMSAVRKHFDPTMPEKLIASASGFPIGVGRSRCMCGAISGAILAIGYFFGRSEGKANDPTSEKCLELSHELQQEFRNNHDGTLCCYKHIEGMDILSGEHKKQCVAFTGECAQKAAEIIAREKGVKLVYDWLEAR